MEKRGQFATAQEDEERRKASQLRKEVDSLFKRRKKLRNDMYAVLKAAGVQQPASSSGSTPVSPTTDSTTDAAAERGRSGRRQSAPDAAAVQSADAVAAAVAAAALAPQRASLSNTRARGSPQRPLPPSAAAADMRRSKSAQNMKQMAAGSTAASAAATSAGDAARGASASPSPPLTDERGKQSAWRKMKGLFTGSSGSSSRDLSRPRSATPTRGSSAASSSSAAAAAAAATANAAAGAAAAGAAANASPRPRSDSDDAGPELDLAQVKEALRSQKEELQAVEAAYTEKRKKLAEHQLKAQRLQSAAREAEANMAGPMSAWHALAARVEAHVDAYMTRVADSTAGRSKSAYSNSSNSPAGRGWYGSEREGGDLW
jgi:hypothetical protein